MLPPATRFIGGAGQRGGEGDAASARLVRLNITGAYHSERVPERHLPPAPPRAVAESATTLPIGWEQRIERQSSGSSGGGRIFYIDHTTRSTTLVDPRQQQSAAAVAGGRNGSAASGGAGGAGGTSGTGGDGDGDDAAAPSSAARAT